MYGNPYQSAHSKFPDHIGRNRPHGITDVFGTCDAIPVLPFNVKKWDSIYESLLYQNRSLHNELVGCSAISGLGSANLKILGHNVHDVINS